MYFVTGEHKVRPYMPLSYYYRWFREFGGGFGKKDTQKEKLDSKPKCGAFWN